MARETSALLLSSLLINSYATCDIASNTVVNDWSIATYLNGWSICYNHPYSDATSTSDLLSCPRGENHYIFVGAKETSASSTISIGAYASSSVLNTTTPSTTTAYLPSWTDYPSYEVYWYNFPTKSFGFAASSTIIQFFFTVHICCSD